MNRFRNKKKAKDNGDGVPRPSTESEAPSIPAVKASRTFRRKKQEPEPKPEINIAAALPSSDDFRTSLLMSGLSARFSMLREQDDPNSKIGKASDDSVLFPRRQSKLEDFGFAGLSDIAEVSSINGSIRPPFLGSKTEGYGDNDSIHSGTGSIMNRSKQGEGNNLFGGRQKISMGNRTLYENDVNQSAFQKMRNREKEQRRQELQGQQHIQPSQPDSPPPSGYNRNRETSSTTSSGDAFDTRSSTAATSVTSHNTPSLSGSQTPVTPGAPVVGLDRSIAKTRRLYETGLENQLQEQQSYAMNRVDTLTRKPTLGTQTPPPGLSPTFPPHPSERWDRSQISGKMSMPNLRSAGPPQVSSTLGNFDFGVRSNNTPELRPFGIASPPLSPPVSETEENNGFIVQPNDKGKATALGTFNKPAQPYDEGKYSQRQVQMQQGRETPPLRKHSPPNAFLPRQQAPPLQQQTGRNRAESNSTYSSARSNSNSSAQKHFTPRGRIPESPKIQTSAFEKESNVTSTFLNSPGSSVDLSTGAFENEPKVILRPADLYKMHQQPSAVTLQRPAESQHPMNREKPFEQMSPVESKLPNSISNSTLPTATSKVSAESPSLGSNTGLSGLVRQHLRSDSNSSSVYGGVPSTIYTSKFPVDPLEAQNEYATKNNPWDGGEWDQSYYKDNTSSQHDSANGTGTTPSLTVHTPLTGTPKEESPKAFWEKDGDSNHTRTASIETQKEREDFKNELASRRKKVQENLKQRAETESRSTSPMPGSTWTKETNPVTDALGLLRTKTSRGSLHGKSKESKAMKLLGLGGATMNSSTMPSPSKPSYEDNSWQQEEEMPGGAPKMTVPPPTKAFRQARRDAQRDRERQLALRHQQNLSSEGAEADWSNPQSDDQSFPPSQNVGKGTAARTRRRTPSRERKPPPVTYTQWNGRTSQESKSSMGPESRSSSQARERSGSDTSGGRSKSRNGRYRDDLAKAMAEGLSSTGQGTYDELDVPSARFMPKSPGTPNMAFQQSPMPSPMLGPNGRSRSNSRTAVPTSFFDGRLPGLNGSESPRPSPGAPFVVNPTPPLSQPTPTASGANTPTTHTPQTSQTFVAARKRSINKSEISEPRFLSSTSTVDTVNLPPGASLQNGINAPPIPPVNPRRRAMFGGLRRKESDELSNIPAATQSSEEMSTFSADEGESKVKVIGKKLRKSSSEGGNLNVRARQAVMAEPSPAMPSFPAGSGSPPRRHEGAMF